MIVENKLDCYDIIMIYTCILLYNNLYVYMGLAQSYYHFLMLFLFFIFLIIIMYFAFTYKEK
jgi:hypothetical protein